MSLLDKHGVTIDAVNCMDLIFQLTELIQDKGVSVADLTKVVSVAVESGHETIEVAMSMVVIAIQQAQLKASEQ